MSKVKWVRLWDYIEQSDSKNSQSLYGIVSFPEYGGSSSLLLIKDNQENPSSAVLALRASVVVHGFVPVNKFPHKS